MSYFDHLDYAGMAKNPTQYFENKKVMNFDIIHHECRGDPLNGSYKDYQTVKSKDLKIYPNIKKRGCGWLLTMKVKFKKFGPLGRVPTKATPGSACYDVNSSIDITIRPGGTEKVPLDIGFKFSKKYVC